MEKQPENEPESQEAEAMEPELRAPAPGQVYAPSASGVSVTSGRTAPREPGEPSELTSEPGEPSELTSEPGEPSELTSESGEPSELTESEPGITESESRSDSSIAGSSTGPLMMEFLAQAEEQVASHSGATSTATGPRVSPTETTRLLQEFVQACHPELVAGFPSYEAARRVGRALAVLGDEMEEQRPPALRRMMEQVRIPKTRSKATLATITQASTETLSNISQQFSKSVRSEIEDCFGSVSSFLQGFFSFVATKAALAATGVSYELVDTTQVQASALSSTTDSLLTLSRTGLMTEYNASSLQVTNSIQLHEGSYPLMRFTSSPFGTVIAANKHLFLYGENPWSENTGQHILDVSNTGSFGSTDTRARLFALAMSEIRIYDLTRDSHTLSSTVRLPWNDTGRMALFGDFLYITREGEGLVKRMDIHTHEITEIASGLERPTAITALGSHFAVADDHNVRIYASNTNNLIITIPVGTAIFDIEMVGDRIFVLTRDEIRSYRLRL